MEIEKMLISILILSTIMVVFSMAYGDVIKYYSPSYPYGSEKFRTFNQSFNTISRYMSDVQNHTTGVAEKSWTDLTKYYDVVLAVISVGKVFSQMPAVFTTYINMLQTTEQGEYMLGFKIPSVVTSLITGIVVVIIVMAVAKIFLKRDRI